MSENMRLSAEPQEQDFGTGGVAAAHDAQGNPVCPDCGASGIVFAALANSGSKRTCWCPPLDTRIQAQPPFRADAMAVLIAVLDILEADCARHEWNCYCGACRAAGLIRRGGQP